MAGVTVCAAILRNERGQLLICKRGPGGSCAHLWEFPGGKLEPGETLEQCLVRECREELGVGIRVLNLYSKTVHEYPERITTLYFYNAEIIDGTPERRVHEEILWAHPKTLPEFPFCPADVRMIEQMAREAL